MASDFLSLTELAHLLGAADRGACHGVDGGIIGKIMTAAAKDEMDIYGKVDLQFT